MMLEIGSVPTKLLKTQNYAFISGGWRWVLDRPPSEPIFYTDKNHREVVFIFLSIHKQN